MDVPETKKIDVLLHQLQERYDALHKMRDRSMHFVLWILGLGLGMAWLLLSETLLTVPQRALLAVLLLVMWLVVWFFVGAIEHGFHINRAIAIRIETSLKLYEQNCYGISDAVLPSEFASQEVGWRGHFRMLKTLSTIVFLILMLIVLANPCKIKSTWTAESADPNQIQTQSIVEK